MTAIQLEFNLENETETDFRLSFMQRQIDEMNNSMGKVRRKIFSEVGELKKMCITLQAENSALKSSLMEITNQKEKWVYNRSNLLFDIQ